MGKRKTPLKENPALTPAVKRHNAIHDQATLLLDNIDALIAVDERVTLEDLPRDAEVLRLALRHTANKVRDLRIAAKVQHERNVQDHHRVVARSERYCADIETFKATIKALLK